MKQVAKWLAMAAFVVSVLSLLPLIEIEGRAIRQPQQPAGEYTAPLRVKGSVYYVTPNQKFYDSLAFAGFIGGAFVSMFAMAFFRWSERQQNSN